MESVKLSVRELVGYVYKGGDLTSEGISAERAMIGTKIHKKLQSLMDTNYQKEYYLKHTFIYQGIEFLVEGRADGIITNEDEIIIDEIKSTYADLDYVDEDYNKSHSAQAMCYGYFYALQQNIRNIYIQVRYCNIETEKIKELIKEYTFDELEKFFYDMVDVYLEWAKINVEHMMDKTLTIGDLIFPFEKYRKGQRELLVAVYQTIRNKNKLYVQAPTGIGKTISVLFPAIKALNMVKNSKIYYLTSKSSTKSIAEETIKKLQNNGAKIRTTIITAKEKICLNDTFKCDSEVCPYAKGYYNKINNVMLEVLKSEHMFNREYIEKMAKKYQVCPFELTLELGYVSDIVVCDYNYYFDPRVALQRDDFLNNTKDILLVDESHNLEDRTRNMYSCELVKEEFYEVYKEIKNEDAVGKKIVKQFKDINSAFISLRKSLEDTKNMVLMEEPYEFIKLIRQLAEKLEKWMHEKGSYTNEKLEDIYFKSMFFVKLSEIYDDSFCYYISKTDKFKVKIMLVDTSDILKSILKNSYSSIFFSATLTPLKYYRQILGGDSETDKVLSLLSPFDIDKLKFLISGDVSMKYNIRDLNIDKICTYINTMINAKKGNYLIFFPSYSYLNKVYERYEGLYDDKIIVNSSSLAEDEQINIINMFKNEKNVVLFTVVGGVFSEGINLPLDMLIGAIVIGTGIPQLSFERDIIRNYFDSKYNSGFDFAYKYPGFNKVLQSIGRVIRTEYDLGAVFLIDSRLLSISYLSLLPSHLKKYNVTYNNNQLSSQLNNFWYGGEKDD